MSNHVHLIIKEETENIDQIIKRIAGSYVYWYNWKYYRKGHLFQDRFKSEPVEDENYLMTVIRYIHQNPVKAGIIQKIDEYEYSSFNEYINNIEDGIIDKDFIYTMTNREIFIEFNKQNNDDQCLDIENFVFRISDDDAKKIIRKIAGVSNSTEIQLFSRVERDNCIRKMKQKGLSIRQISRLTGISKGIVERVQ